MSRSLWFVAGAGAGVYAMARARRVAEAVTVDGLKDRLSGLAVGARMFREEVAAGQAEKEDELRERLGLVAPGTPALPGPHPGPDTLADARRSTSEITGARRSTTAAAEAGRPTQETPR